MAIYQSKDTMLVKNDVMHDGGPLSPLSLDMLPGDVAVLSNLTMLHAKTEFKDHGDPDKVSLPPHPLPALLHLDISFSVTPMGRMPKLCPCPSCLALSVLTRPAGTQHTSCASGLPPQPPPPPILLSHLPRRAICCAYGLRLPMRHRCPRTVPILQLGAASTLAAGVGKQRGRIREGRAPAGLTVCLPFQWHPGTEP